MKKLLLGSALLALTLLSCSTEQGMTEQPIKLSELVNTCCKRSFSPKESRSDFYRTEMEVKPKVSILVDKNGVADFKVTDLKENCIVSEFRPTVKVNGEELIVVLIPYATDPTVEADCYCRYDVGFKVSNILQGKYILRIYISNYFGEYNTENPIYEGWLTFAPNHSFGFEL